MNRKILYIALTIALAAALVGGATMAYFSYKVEAVNEFTAGTVSIEAGDEVVYSDDLSMDNVNPGDAFKKCIPIENTGTKNIRLSMTADLGLEINWGWIGSNFDELCFSGDWDDVDALQSAVQEALITGNVTNPADAVGDPNGPFDEAGNLVIPVMVAPTANGDWFMKNVEGQKVFFYDGILEPGAETKLCVIVVFDGPWMGNLWQDATFTLGGKFEAVQSSNDAPEYVWGTGVWENYVAVSSLAGDPKAQLEVDFSEAYVNYFYDNDTFIYADLCEVGEQNGNDNGNDNGNGECWTETAWAGETSGAGAAWWFYFDRKLGDTQIIWAGQDQEAGSVTISLIENNGYVKIEINFDSDWGLDPDKSEPVKIKGYNSEDVPDSRPAAGQLNDYKGDELTVYFYDMPPHPYDVYVIHLDVQICE